MEQVNQIGARECVGLGACVRWGWGGGKFLRHQVRGVMPAMPEGKKLPSSRCALHGQWLVKVDDAMTTKLSFFLRMGGRARDIKTARICMRVRVWLSKSLSSCHRMGISFLFGIRCMITVSLSSLCHRLSSYGLWSVISGTPLRNLLSFWARLRVGASPNRFLCDPSEKKVAL